jgi:hypothetical protein
MNSFCGRLSKRGKMNPAPRRRYNITKLNNRNKGESS